MLRIVFAYKPFCLNTPKTYLCFTRLAPVGEGFRRMEELYGLDARLSLYKTNGESDHHARYELMKIIMKAFRAN